MCLLQPSSSVAPSHWPLQGVTVTSAVPRVASRLGGVVSVWPRTTSPCCSALHGRSKRFLPPVLPGGCRSPPTSVFRDRSFPGSTGTFSRCVAPASSSASGSSLDILRLQQLGPELPSWLSASTNGDHFLPDFEKRKKKFLRAGRGLGSTCKSQSIVACPLLLRDQPVHRRLGAIELLCKHRGPQAATWPRAVEQTGVHTSLLGARGTAARPQPPGGPKESLLQKKISFMYS
ncbi:uncharacterized protein LOC111098237 isoform X2 [Canis lupus familiaris]|uniref:uncharacterized protein LOC111098237 isoform X2 n=1 Tax=Canis lupus familiaris TaxID=9615 RepID=UPI0018F57D47|nr:uncharacterized protein LOC111098237 isoform X2 [Canis lupus familiaris]XP_038509661.1 uncharacterized protein LOC111098237 isoform X2 [Canis lupus familiaris]